VSGHVRTFEFGPELCKKGVWRTRGPAGPELRAWQDGAEVLPAWQLEPGPG
jgi:hypothetical protein